MLIGREITEHIIGAAIEVHRHLGPGLLESAYEECLCYELLERRIAFQRQVPLPVTYKGRLLDCSYKMDLVVEAQIVAELKAVEQLERIHEALLLTYLRLSGLRVGLLINFNSLVLKDGIIRRAL